MKIFVAALVLLATCSCTTPAATGNVAIATGALKHYFSTGMVKEPITVCVVAKNLDWRSIVAGAGIQQPNVLFTGGPEFEERDGLFHAKSGGNAVAGFVIWFDDVSREKARVHVRFTSPGVVVVMRYEMRKLNGTWLVASADVEAAS